MKMSKRVGRNVRPSPSPRPLMILDEFHTLPSGNLDALRLGMSAPRGPTAIQTQAIVRRNSGKRVRFISYTKWASGESMTRAKKKFLPVQVLRRQQAGASET